MKWIVKLVAEATSGNPVEHEIATLERDDLISPAIIGLSIIEGKLISHENSQSTVSGKERARVGPSVTGAWPLNGVVPPESRSGLACTPYRKA